MSKKYVFSLLFVLTFSLAALAQGAQTPAKGSPERAAILSALRVPVERELKQKIQFSVEKFKVQGDWAFLGGARPNYKGTRYQQAINAGAFDNNFFALLRKTGGKWKVVKYAIGCTDVCYEMWWRDYKAPKALFSYIE